MGAKYFGASVKRREDPRFLRGEGRYVDDIKLPGMLHAAFVRSPYAHARITGIRTEAARWLPGVAHVFTFADLERWMKPLPLFGAIPPGLAARVQVSMRQIGQLAMCRDEVRHVGEIVAMALASSRALVEDACERVDVGYEPLPVLADVVAAGEPGAPVLYPEWGDNVALSFKTGFGDVEAALRQADARVRERFVIPRYVGMPIETRGVVAQWDVRDGSLTTWNGTQVVHFVQQGLVAALGLPPSRIHKSCASTINGVRPGPTSFDANPRPSAGVTPSRSNKPGDVVSRAICDASRPFDPARIAVVRCKPTACSMTPPAFCNSAMSVPATQPRSRLKNAR